jgi:hypothetical protein
VPRSHRERRNTAQQPEVRTERIAISRPGVDAEQALADELQPVVAERKGCEPDWVAAVHVDEFQPCEGDQAKGRRPRPEALRIGERLGQPPGEPPLPSAPRGAPDSTPRIEEREHVAEQDRQRNKTHPEGDEDEAGQQVVRRQLAPVQTRVDEERESQDADRAAQRIKDTREGGDTPFAGRLEARTRPQRPQRDERQDHRGGRAPHEEPARDRQRRRSEDAVGIGRRRET